MLKILENDIDSFFDVPFEIYKDQHFVSLFKDDIKRFLSKDNPLFREGDNFKFFTAMRDNRPVGRIVALYHKASNTRHNLNWAYFGYFDCENSIETARALMEKATSWCKEKGFPEIVGNINFTFMQQIGVMVEGFENFPYSDQVYSPPYMPQLLTELGFQSFFPMTTSEVELKNVDLKIFEKEKIKKLEADPNFKFVEVGYFGIDKLMLDADKVLNEGFDKNPYFTPVTLEEFKFQAKDMMLVIDPGLTVLAYHNDEPVGIVICIPDLNPLLYKTKSRMNLNFFIEFIKFRFIKKRAVIIFYSVSPKFGGIGLNQTILKRVINNLIKKKYTHMGITWIYEENQSSLKQIEILKGKVLHRLKLFKKNI